MKMPSQKGNGIIAVVFAVTVTVADARSRGRKIGNGQGHGDHHDYWLWLWPSATSKSIALLLVISPLSQQVSAKVYSFTLAKPTLAKGHYSLKQINQATWI